MALPVFVALLTVSDPLREPPAEQRAKVESLIQDLGSSNYATREHAYLTLEKIGGDAYEPLKRARLSPDAETRSRANLLLSGIHQGDFDRRVRLFLGGSNATQLPGLPEYFARVGDTKSTRDFFAEVIREPNLRKLLILAETAPDTIPVGVQSHVAELIAMRNQRGVKPQPQGLVVRPVLQAAPRNDPNLASPFSLNDILGTLLIDSLATQESRQAKRLGNSSTQLLYQAPLRTLLMNQTNSSDAEKVRIAQAIISMWIESREEATELSVAITYGNQYQLTDAVAVAVRKQLDNKNATGPMRGVALGGLAKALGSKAVPKIEKYLTDTTQGGMRYEAVNDGNGRVMTKQYPIEMRDIAFAATIHLNGKDPRDYGMQVYSMNDAQKFQSTNAWFKTDDERKAAFAKFEAERVKKP